MARHWKNQILVFYFRNCVLKWREFATSPFFTLVLEDITTDLLYKDCYPTCSTALGIENFKGTEIEKSTKESGDK